MSDPNARYLTKPQAVNHVLILPAAAPQLGETQVGPSMAVDDDAFECLG